MESLFKEMLALYGDFAEKARQHREKVSLLQQNTEQFQHEKVEKMVQAEKSDFSYYTKRQQAQAERAAQSIMQQAQARDAAFDIGALDGLINYICAARGRTDFKLIEKQLAAFRGCDGAIRAVYAVAQANDAPATVLGTIKAMFCNLDEISQKLEKNVYNVFNMLDDAGHAGEVLCMQAAKLGCDVQNTVKDDAGAAHLFGRLLGLNNG